MINGQLNWNGAQSAACPELPRAATWFNVEVVVKEDASAATIFLNGKQVVVQAMKLPKHIGGGIVVANGYENIVQFRNLHVIPW